MHYEEHFLNLCSNNFDKQLFGTPVRLHQTKMKRYASVWGKGRYCCKL